MFRPASRCGPDHVVGRVPYRRGRDHVRHGGEPSQNSGIAPDATLLGYRAVARIVDAATEHVRAGVHQGVRRL